jgi:Helix-turn-helix domain
MKDLTQVHVRPQLSAAVQRVEGVLVSAEAARVIVFLLGNYAKLAESRNGCVPDGLREVQGALAEAVAAGSRGRDGERVAAPAVLPLSHDVIELEQAAEVLGMKADSVRNLCRRGGLDAQKRRGRWFVSASAVAQRVEEGCA